MPARSDGNKKPALDAQEGREALLAHMKEQAGEFEADADRQIETSDGVMFDPRWQDVSAEDMPLP